MKMLFAIVALSFTVGCARFSTTQKDLSYENGQPQRQITTHAAAYTLLASKSALASWKASQTDKTQGASVGGLAQESSGAEQLGVILGEAIRTAAGIPRAAIAPAPVSTNEPPE